MRICSMKLSVAALLVPVAAIALASCADDGYAANHRGSHYSARLAYYDGYYDDFYGPVWGGYWGPDQNFYYRSSPRAPFIRDEAHHFRHEQFERAHSFHMR